jgi:hypothetical protein
MYHLKGIIVDNLIIGYLISVIVGIPITYIWSEFLHGKVISYRTKEDAKAERVLWIPILVGVFERLIITTFIIFSVSGTAGFIGAWIALKSAGGWATWSKGTTYGRSVFFIGLLGSAMSVSLAILGGFIATAVDLPIVVTSVAGSTAFDISNILINLATLLVLFYTLIFAKKQVRVILAQLKQTSSHNFTGLSNKQNWKLFERYKAHDLAPMLPAWEGLNKTGWSWRILILNHLNLLFEVHQDYKNHIMEKSDYQAWVLKGQYWFQNLRSENSKYQQGREILKKILKPEEGFTEEFINWLICERIIDLEDK